jgi:hypothetical protein
MLQLVLQVHWAIFLVPRKSFFLAQPRLAPITLPLRQAIDALFGRAASFAAVVGALDSAIRVQPPTPSIVENITLKLSAFLALAIPPLFVAFVPSAHFCSPCGLAAERVFQASAAAPSVRNE